MLDPKTYLPLWLAAILLLGWPVIASHPPLPDGSTRLLPTPQAAWAAEPDQRRDLKWFKEQMGIAPQYQPDSGIVLGMSWPHLLIMGFLAVFFVFALIAVYVRNRRTHHLLQQLVKEKSDEPQG
ncbi:MAG: hypothetical protein KKA46_07515 [Proteobacteria bacterium]|nr:hypothetical protein [Pseudomonadota bacterium]